MRSESHLGGLRGDLNLTAQVIEASHEAQNRLGAIAAREVLGTEVCVFDTIFEHVPGGIEHRGGDRQDGFFGAAPCAQAGLDYRLARNWFLNADVKYVQIEPDLKYRDVKIATVKVDPILAGVGIAYRF